LDIVLM